MSREAICRAISGSIRRWTTCAANEPGVACVIVEVATSPVAIPLAIALSRTVSMGTESGPTPIAALKVRRSEEHTSELQSRGQLVCRLLLEKKKMHGQYHN